MEHRENDMAVAEASKRILKICLARGIKSLRRLAAGRKPVYAAFLHLSIETCAQREYLWATRGEDAGADPFNSLQLNVELLGIDYDRVVPIVRPLLQKIRNRYRLEDMKHARNICKEHKCKCGKKSPRDKTDAHEIWGRSLHYSVKP